MTRRRCSAWQAAALVIAVRTVPLMAQVRTIDTGGPPGSATAAQSCSTDSLITAALTAFNGAAAVRISGGSARIPAGDSIAGGYGVFHGAIRVDGSIRGDLIVLDGNALLTTTASVSGDVIVLGGRLTAETGARITGRQRECTESVNLMVRADGTVAIRPETRSLGARASQIGVRAGPVWVTPHVGIGEYNRIEALPLQLGANGVWGADAPDTVRGQAYAIIPTTRDPNHSRPAIEWYATSQWEHTGRPSYTIGFEGGSTVTSTLDRPFSSVESGLSAFLLRRDYHDWYLRRGGSVFASLTPAPGLTFSSAYEISRQTTVLAVDAFSVLRSSETWRANPLIDDGKYRIASFRFSYDGRDELAHPTFQWYTRAEIRRVTSGSLSPVSLPTEIRDPMPGTNYGSTDADIDLRGYLRFNPEARLNARFFAGGYVAGDPLTIQRRRAIGGADPLAGYDFRAINCDRRRRPDPSLPALCDREMAFQLEYHHTLPIDVSTRVGPYTVGVRKPDLVLLGDAGTAWLAGDSAGRVPSNRIEALKEWRSDLGVGVTTGQIGFYLAKSLVDPIGVQVLLLFNARF